MTRAPFGRLPDGGSVDVCTLSTRHGLEARVLTYGGIVASLRVPDRAGRLDDVVLGFDSLEGYLSGSPYFGAIVGRYANRIAGGRFVLEGRSYALAANDPPNHLHGGRRGFDKRVWSAEEASREDAAAVRLRYTSAAGEEGYPGQLEATVTYALTDAGELRVDYEARASETTPVNLSHHSYFNLAGAGRGDVLGHELTIHADRYTPVDETMIPTGELLPVAGTPFDFREPSSIGGRLGADDPQLARGRGYDHNFVLRGSGNGLAHAARLVEPASGRRLDVHTTEPGLQFYSGNKLHGLGGKGGHVYGPHAGLCLETQHFPDSPNRPSFPSTLVSPGREYRSTTVFTFAVC